MAKHRTQLFLDPNQYERLREISVAEGCSISAVVRRFVDRGLTQRHEALDTSLEILRRAARFRQSLEEHHGAYPGDPVDEVRGQRSRQQERLLTSPAP